MNDCGRIFTSIYRRNNHKTFRKLFLMSLSAASKCKQRESQRREQLIDEAHKHLEIILCRECLRVPSIATAIDASSDSEQFLPERSLSEKYWENEQGIEKSNCYIPVQFQTQFKICYLNLQASCFEQTANQNTKWRGNINPD